MTTAAWREALPAPPAGCRLIGAWLTAFEPPDAALLVEHLLPSLLGMSGELSTEVSERNQFFAGLADKLESLRGRLTIISSPARTTAPDAAYPWLWRYVRHFTVGAEQAAVQHAKLWAFHWKGKDAEWLELHVSSTNLTMAAFKGQLQAGWQATLRLEHKRRSLAQWGQLIPFLDALGAAAGEHATRSLADLTGLLSRATCPEGVTFIASIPGKRGAARAIASTHASEVHILTPTVGEWNDSSLAAWAKDAGIPEEKIHLKWIDRSHPWAGNAGWALSRAARDALLRRGLVIDHFAAETRVAREHRTGDQRWSHAKIYLLVIGRRQQRQLLVTSANWSHSAWGAGSVPPRNFELGVLISADCPELEKVAEPLDPEECHCVDRPPDEDASSALQWAEATWDGTQISLSVRTSDASLPIKAQVRCAGVELPFDVPVAGRYGALAWSEPEHPPLFVHFRQGAEQLEVPVLDLRSPQNFHATPLPEVDPNVAQALREALLLQRYGGPAVEMDAETGKVLGHSGAAAPAGDYSVQAWVDARRAFDSVDAWKYELDRPEGIRFDRAQLLQDGIELSAIFERRGSVAGRLAAEELKWRLEVAE